MSAHYNLKALIKSIRATKTIADERVLITKESAAIRSAFKEEDAHARHNNVAKLLYIHMLGYPAHFGQIECLKLVASPKFTDKRLGYLGIMLLLDENQEVLTLVTNSLKNDMNHSSASIVSLALCTFANIASEEMARDLVTEIERCLGSGNAYIRKKAALAALRSLYKVPDLVDHFEGRAMSLLGDRNHGVLLTGITLVTEMVRLVGPDPFRSAVPLLVRHLKSLVTTNYSPEHDVSGITDPFLQVKILRLLRLLGTGDADASETMNDILAQVATNTESAKNVGNSILYETVLTILDIEADSGLRVMAINILGKFLGNRDNNIRYVALNTLLKVVAIDTNAVQRHRAIILDCLRDGDISIRRRALELSYALVNEQNVRVLTRELLAFLEVADNEFKLGITTQVCSAAERFAPNRRWHIDTVLRVLKLAGNYVKEEVLSSFIRLVTHTPDLQSYTVYKLYTALKADVSQEGLTLAGVWMIGEYGDVLLQSGGGEVEEDGLAAVASVSAGGESTVSEKDVLDLLERILVSPYTNTTIRQFVLTALAKLSTRFSHPESFPRITKTMHGFDASVELELQQRAIEFGKLLTLDSIRGGVLERMPPPELKPTVMGTVSEKRPVGSLRRDKDALLDLMGDESSTPGRAAATVAAAVPAQSAQDLLADIFGSGEAASTPAGTAAAKQSDPVNDIMSLFSSTSLSQSTGPAAPAPASASNDFFSMMGTSSSPAAPTPAAPTPAPAAPAAAASGPQAHEAYNRNGLRITLTPVRDANNRMVVNILAKFEATQPTSSVNFQAAVPKTQKLQMLAMSKTDVAPGSTETQQLRVMVPAPGALVRLRLRVAYTTGGQQVQDQTDFAFPAELMAGP
ncbi:AP-1 complex subunit gamma-1 [Rhodotorula sp. JG-1b]|nr:AP-1 complex subunit gamma-1 [Rhodotorula sp. JG-1b]